METPNLTTPESQTHNLDLDFVLPVPGSNEPDFTRLYFSGNRMGMSVESVDLRFKHTRPRSVYGTIYMNSSESFNVHTLYNRPTSDDAETMSEPSGGPLTLCGPKYFVEAYSTRALYVDLYEAGEDGPFFNERAPLSFGDVFSGPTHSISVDAPGGDATLTIRMTAIMPATLSNVSVELSSPLAGKEWSVSGSMKAIQATRGGSFKGEVTLFNRPDDHPVRATDRIRLDRDVLLAPLVFEKDHILEMDDFHLENGYSSSGIDPDDDLHNGLGCHLSVSVDLRLVDETQTSFLVRGTCHYQFKSSHATGALFRATFHPITGEDDILVSVILEPFLDIMSSMDEEPYENEMTLYIDSDSEPPSDLDEHTDTDSEDEDMLSNTDQMESKDEESNKP